MAIGSIMSAGVGLSNTPNPYSSASYYNVGKASFNTADAVRKSVGTPSAENARSEKADENGKKSGKFKDGFGEEECQTCKNRKYQDVSDDSGVSFQTPTKISKGAAAAAVRSHEQEHVSRNQAKAEREGNEIVSQSVVIKTGVCPECGEVYIAGGETRTTTKSSQAKRFDVGLSQSGGAVSGKALDTVA